MRAKVPLQFDPRHAGQTNVYQYADGHRRLRGEICLRRVEQRSVIACSSQQAMERDTESIVILDDGDDH